MERPCVVLANIENFGRIYRCGDCDNIHLLVGPMNISFSVDAWVELVALVNTSASNFELLAAAGPGTDKHERHA